MGSCLNIFLAISVLTGLSLIIFDLVTHANEKLNAISELIEIGLNTSLDKYFIGMTIFGVITVLSVFVGIYGTCTSKETKEIYPYYGTAKPNKSCGKVFFYGSLLTFVGTAVLSGYAYQLWKISDDEWRSNFKNLEITESFESFQWFQSEFNCCGVFDLNDTNGTDACYEYSNNQPIGCECVPGVNENCLSIEEISDQFNGFEVCDIPSDWKGVFSVGCFETIVFEADYFMMIVASALIAFCVVAGFSTICSC